MKLCRATCTTCVTMRILPVVICTLCIVLSVVEARKRQAKPCTTSAECGTNQCCLSPAVFRGRREAGGYCTTRGAQGGSKAMSWFKCS
ncbi:hypothetical protein Btru_072856 [Bulinus truncatus]|nr:hypothetical protein Btru_072856 [Bulinus truncatus]